MSEREQDVAEFLNGLGGGLSAAVEEIQSPSGQPDPGARKLILIRQGGYRSGVLALSKPGQSGADASWWLCRYRMEDRKQFLELSRALIRRFNRPVEVWNREVLDAAIRRLIC